MGEHGIEQVALHVVVGITLLVHHLLVLARHHIPLHRIFLLIGLDEENSLAIERWHLEKEATAVVSLLHHARRLIARCDFRFHEHLLAQRAMIDAQLAVPHLFSFVHRFRRFLLCCVIVLGRVGRLCALDFVHRLHHLLSQRRL